MILVSRSSVIFHIEIFKTKQEKLKNFTNTKKEKLYAYEKVILTKLKKNYM